VQPAQLTPASFATYPPEARAFAASQIALLREMPIALAPILLRELINYDWKLPAERRELNNQFVWLTDLSQSQRKAVFAGFQALPLEPSLTSLDWVNNPSGFMESLTAWLWSSHRMETFRTLADAYAASLSASVPPHLPTMPRLGIVVIGAGATVPATPLFRKLKPFGVHLTHIVPENGLATLIAEVSRRANAKPSAFNHWYIDGGAATPNSTLTQVSYAHLEQPRAKLLSRIQQAIATGSMGPEELRTLLTHIKPADLGIGGPSSQLALDHFQLSLLTEGAGTQIFATTFVQWAARECLRRAQPETLLVRFAPRQQEQPMNAMLTGASVIGTDAAGSLIDADLGAYYTWINFRRLSGSDQLRFLVWFEDHTEAVAIGPGLPRGATSSSQMGIDQVLNLFA
jgi:hypothetical protein